jgi:VIT1/CCC1 family predicted Fe2+/Mn2+ transporter
MSTKKALGMSVRHKELHRTKRIGWLRAAVLGANDGIVSTASLVLGVVAAHGTRSNVLVAGAMVMAAGEYGLSIHRQTLNKPHSSMSARSSKQTTRASTRN